MSVLSAGFQEGATAQPEEWEKLLSERAVDCHTVI